MMVVNDDFEEGEYPEEIPSEEVESEEVGELTVDPEPRKEIDDRFSKVEKAILSNQKMLRQIWERVKVLETGYDEMADNQKLIISKL